MTAMLLGIAAVAEVSAQEVASWIVSSAPTVRIVGGETEAAGQLAHVVGATRLPSGHIWVGDRGQFGFYEYAPNGTFIRRFARNGHGPGELAYFARMFRCGDRVIAYDIEGYGLSVFTLEGRFERLFRWGRVPGGTAPYGSACNAAGMFVHYSFETSLGEGAYRKQVPMWASRSDSSVGVRFPDILGSERWGTAAGGRVTGSRPLPLGKQPLIAIGANRVYVATGDQPTVTVYSLDGKLLPPIRVPFRPRPVTAADIEAELEKEIATGGESRRAELRRSYAAMKLPKTLPLFGALLVDREDCLWVQEAPRASALTAAWRVFDPSGALRAQVNVPAALTLTEVGADYVLGRYLNQDDDTVEVRQYALSRGAAPPRR